MQAARLASVSKTTIRRAQEDGEFTSHPGENGEHLIDEAEFRTWLLQRQKQERTRRGGAAPDSGAIAALAFDRFDQNENPVDVVKAHQLDPDRAERLHDQWARLRGRVFVSPEVLDEFARSMARFLDVPAAPARSPEALQQWLKALVSGVEKLFATARRPCARCRRPGSDPSTCPQCVEDVRLKQRIQIEKIRAGVKEHEALVRSYNPSVASPRRKQAQAPTLDPLYAEQAFSETQARLYTTPTKPTSAPAPDATLKRGDPVPASWFSVVDESPRGRKP